MIDPATDILRPRRPARSNGRERYAALLDAFERLLEKQPSLEISLADVAEAANAPIASAYHFFPSKGALQIGLADRYLSELEARVSHAIEGASFDQWFDIYDASAAACRDYFNENGVALKLIYGSECSVFIKQLDRANNRRIAELSRRAVCAAFFTPPEDQLVRPFELATDIVDAIWSSSYHAHKRISDDYDLEARKASRSYLASYLAPNLPRRT